MRRACHKQKLEKNEEETWKNNDKQETWNRSLRDQQGKKSENAGKYN